MYLIIDVNNVCIGMLEDYHSAVGMAKKLGAKAVKEAENVSALGNIGEDVWTNTYNSDIVRKNRIGAIAPMALSILSAMVSYNAGETYGVSIVLFAVSIIMFFTKDKCF